MERGLGRGVELYGSLEAKSQPGASPCLALGMRIAEQKGSNNNNLGVTWCLQKIFRAPRLSV